MSERQERWIRGVFRYLTGAALLRPRGFETEPGDVSAFEFRIALDLFNLVGQASRLSLDRRSKGFTQRFERTAR